MSDREYPAAPRAAVGAVALQNDRVLLARRARQPLQGEWSLPGGAVELGETLRQAVAREVLEECGLTVVPVSVLGVFDRIDRDPEQRVRFHYVLVEFLCEVTGGALRAGSDAREVCWAPLPEVRAGGRWGLTPATLAVIEQAVTEKAGMQKAGMEIASGTASVTRGPKVTITELQSG
jgi:8-oxo-dGTP diphosphatase